MAAALTDELLADFQADLAIGTDQNVFTDAQLARNYERARNNYNLAVAISIRQLQMDAAKFNNYTAGQSSEQKDQIFQHLKIMYDQWRQAADEGDQVKIVGMRAVPPRRKAKPYQRRFKGGASENGIVFRSSLQSDELLGSDYDG